MSDLIKRSDAIKAIINKPAWHGSDGSYYHGDDIRDALNGLPSADRPQGEWIESFKRVETRRGAYLGTKFVHDGWSCSECSEVVEKRYPNCPYCLARMKGADDED